MSDSRNESNAAMPAQPFNAVPNQSIHLIDGQSPTFSRDVDIQRFSQSVARSNSKIRSDVCEDKSTSAVPNIDCCDGPETGNGSDQDKLEPIAIVGLACRFPQDATSPEAFWQMLIDARSAMTDVPRDRFNIDAFYDNKTNTPGMVLIPINIL